MDIIGLRVFPLSMTGEAAIWFSELPFNSIYTWEQLRDVILARYYPVSEKLNHKYRVNNFVSLLGESVSSYWDRFTSFLRSLPIRRYFYRGKMITIRRYLILLRVVLMVSALMQRSQKFWRKFAEITRLGALGSRTLRETPLQCKLHTTRLQMRFLKR